GALAERVSALESACDDIARGRAPEETMPEAHRASTARVSSEIPDDWRRGVEQLATLRDELRDEHVSPRILGRFDAILRRLGAPIRAAAGVSDGTLHVLCARVGDRRFAIPKNVIAAVRPARRAPTSRFAGEDVFPIRLDDTDAPTDDIDLPTDDTDTTTDDIDPPTDDTDTTTDDIMLHVIVETGRGRVAIGVTEVTGEATLWNVGPNSSGDPRFLRVGIDADEREWEILDVAALAPSSHAVEGGQDDDGALVAANGRPRPNAAPLLRALSRGDGR
ncbi:MAG: hypothetical protein KJ042_18705, partial [Deltaproteobacteria bacterium]|nr:hypothetical protein [Deltaproteobacteria bacterium]